MEEQEKTLEETLEELEGIIEQIGQRDIPLEDSFVLYQQGVEKLKYCSDKIDAVEKKLRMLNEKGEELCG